MTCSPEAPRLRGQQLSNSKPNVEDSIALPVNKAQQIVTMQQVCPPGSAKSCKPDYPLSLGSTFFVRTFSDSGLAVTQKVIAGNVSPLGGTGSNPLQYRVNGPGNVLIQGVQPGNFAFASATDVELQFTVLTEADSSASMSCGGLFSPPAAARIQRIDLAGMITLIGNPTPFVVAAQGSNTILIYSNRLPLTAREEAIRVSIIATIKALSGRRAESLGLMPTTKPFSVELIIPHAVALGDLAKRISGLNYSKLTVQSVGRDKVRVTAPAQPDCATWTAFLGDLRLMQWQVVSEPLDMKLYYLSSTDAAAAFSALPQVPAPGSPATDASKSPVVSTISPGSPGSMISLAQPPGSLIDIRSDTTPCVIAGLASGNAGACGPIGASAAPIPALTPSVPQTPQAPIGMAAMGVAMGTGEQSPSDLLVFSNEHPGDDAGIQERKRILAQLDLPRPEMIINAWVLQNSTASSEAMGAFKTAVKSLVAEYNGQIENIVLAGWEDIKSQLTKPNYFDDSFYHYISDRYVADTFSDSTPVDAEEAAQKYLDSSQAHMADPVAPQTRTDFGLCSPGRYCLGYSSLFKPLKPRLTDLLLTLIAARNPIEAAESSIRAVDGSSVSTPANSSDDFCEGQFPNVEEASRKQAKARCKAIKKNLDMYHFPRVPSLPECEYKDLDGILRSLLHGSPGKTENDWVPRVHLQCFEQAVNKYMSNGLPPNGIGLLRSEIADFLFNYKLSQQYPHEFTPYDLTQSADSLNAALTPLVDAFNRDVIAYQTFMRADLQFQVEKLNGEHSKITLRSIVGFDKASFYNDAIVTVRTISGQWTNVNTTSQSFLDASSAPQISTLLNNLLASAQKGADPTSSALGGVLSPGPLKAAGILSGALNSYQGTSAQIGRSLNVSVLPRSLSTASSAEIAITLNADESAGGPLYTGGPANSSTQPNTSRVASHDTATRVRVQSIKLFDVSSFAAIVQRSKSRFPLLPPFVEIPYIGTLVGIPLPGAKEYHSSIAVLSAMVVPTAADIAFGLRFSSDLIVDGDSGACSFVKGSAGVDVSKSCRFRKAVSMHDFRSSPIRNFHRSMMQCFSTDMSSPYSNLSGSTPASNDACRLLSFDRVPHEIN